MNRKVAVTFVLGLDCLYDSDVALAEAPTGVRWAPLFAIEAPASARAGEPFSLNAWVSLAGPGQEADEILPETFTAEVDVQARTITLSGHVRRHRVLASAAPQPRIQRALVVGIRVVAPAGTYTLRIPPSSFASPGGLPLGEVPAPQATQLFVVSPA